MPAASPKRLVLGTVQLGMDYGVANATGRPDAATALEIVREAWQGGVREFDTAQGYGESEAVLGGIFAELGIAEEARVATKPDKSLDYGDLEALAEAVRNSARRMGVPRLQTVLLHSETFLDAWDLGLSGRFSALRDQGLLERTGISVYSPQAALRALATDGLDAVQIPCNALDRRFERAGVFLEAEERGKTLYVRSVYLQGLLLMNPDQLPGRVAHAKNVVARFQALAQRLGLSPAGLALAYVREAHAGVRVLFGAETPAQVRENLALWAATSPQGLVEEVRAVFDDVSETILNPAQW